MFKYGRTQNKTPSKLVCGSCGACLDCVLPGVEVTTGLGFFLHSSHLSYNEDSDSLHALTGLALIFLQVPSGIVNKKYM